MLEMVPWNMLPAEDVPEHRCEPGSDSDTAATRGRWAKPKDRTISVAGEGHGGGRGDRGR
jgi:hypothetical protein